MHLLSAELSRNALDQVAIATGRGVAFKTTKRYVDSMDFDSPLEGMFAVWFASLQESCLGFCPEPFTLRTQVPVAAGQSRYRIDFQVVGSVGFEEVPLKLAIELDGHEFHERTREQVELRNRRDRDLQSAGWKLLHFSFSEMQSDPEKCVTESTIAASSMLREHVLATREW